MFSWAADLFGRPYRTLFLKAIALETPGRYAVQLYGNYVEGGSDPWREQNIIAQVRDVESAEEGLVLLSSLLSSGIPASA